MQKTALITGISGQDGSYLAAHLIKNGYHVIGTSRAKETPWRLRTLAIDSLVTLHTTPLDDKTAVDNLLTTLSPDEIYHLAGQSSAGLSLTTPTTTIHDNFISTLLLIDAIRTKSPQTRFFNASSADIFDPAAPAPYHARSPIAPQTPYGLSKAASHLLIQTYRSNYELFAVNGILFPHESPLRGEQSFLKRFIKEAVAIKNTGKGTIRVGTITNKRDYGDAREYVIAMHKALQTSKADDHIIATGTPVTIEQLIAHVLKQLNLPRSIIETDASLIARSGGAAIFGDTTKTTTTLNWRAEHDIFSTLDDMLAYEQN